MEKKYLTSQEEYFKYCFDNNIVTILQCGQYCEIANGTKCCTCHIEPQHDTLYIYSKPTHYPCMLVWCLFRDHKNDYYKGMFIYQEEFINIENGK